VARGAWRVGRKKCHAPGIITISYVFNYQETCLKTKEMIDKNTVIAEGSIEL